jgi:hypothetical protein
MIYPAMVMFIDERIQHEREGGPSQDSDVSNGDVSSMESITQFFLSLPWMESLPMTSSQVQLLLIAL